MKLTLFTDLSLRVLMFLATRPARRATIAEIAGSFAVSEHHLVKVVHTLGKAGILANVRGKGGGLELARDPGAIRLDEVVRITEGQPQLAECFGTGASQCVINDCCQLRGVLCEALRAFYGVLQRYTLEDLVANRDALDRILFVEAA